MTKLFFATDIHGSDICWNKFLNAGKFYEADVLILGGDMTGKAVVPFIHQGGKNYKITLLEQVYEISTDEEIKVNLSKLPQWKFEDGKIHKLFKFKNFNHAISFIVGVSMVCEKLNHHPEWSNVYGNVDVKLTTHRVAGLTELDFQLAEKMDQLAGDLNLRKD